MIKAPGDLSRALAIVPVLVALLVAGPAAAGTPPDTEPPAILVVPADPAPAGRALVLRARVEDPSGVASVLLWAKGERDREFRMLFMKPTGAGEYAASVPPFEARGSRVFYYVEASDKAGNGPGRSGNRRTPFIARIDDSPAPAAGMASGLTAPIGGASILLWCFVLVVVPLMPLGWLYLRSRSRLNEQFWLFVLTPLAGKRRADRTRALSEICSRSFWHPLRGQIRPTRVEVLRWMNKYGDRLEQGLPQAVAPGSSDAAAEDSPKASAAARARLRDEVGNRLNRRAGDSGIDKSETRAPGTPARRRGEQDHASPKTEETVVIALGDGGPESKTAAPSVPLVDDLAETLEALDEDIFWMQVLEPLIGLPPEQAEEQISELAGRPHQHPKKGWRLFDRQVFVRRLQWARDSDPRQVYAKWSAMRNAPGAGPSGTVSRRT